MKRLSAALLAAFLCLSTLAACGKSGQEPASTGVPDGMKDASDTGVVDYHLYVPENWTVDLSVGAVSAYFPEDEPASVNVMAWSVPHTDYPPSQWWEDGAKDRTAIYADFELVAATETKLDGVSAMRYEWTGKVAGRTYRFLQTAAVRQSMVYIVTYGALADNRFAAHLGDAENILAAFRFT